MDKEHFAEVTDVMLKLGLKPKFVGFEYMREAIEMYINKGACDEKLTTEIYPRIASNHEVTVTHIERNIRIVINDAFKSDGLLSINEFYDSVVYDNSYVLSNGELISIIVEIIRLSQIRKRLVGEH